MEDEIRGNWDVFMVGTDGVEKPVGRAVVLIGVSSGFGAELGRVLGRCSKSSVVGLATAEQVEFFDALIESERAREVPPAIGQGFVQFEGIERYSDVRPGWFCQPSTPRPQKHNKLTDRWGRRK